MADRHCDDKKGELTVLDTPADGSDLEQNRGKNEKVGLGLSQMVASFVTKYWKVLLVAALLLVSHRFAVQSWMDTWDKKNSYYSHGPLVPAIAAFMIWANRKRIAAANIQPSWIGLALMIVAIPIFIFGHWSSSGALLAGTFFLFLIGATLLLFGIKGSKPVIFPLLYLVFMVPLPSTLLDEATFGVQLESTKIASKMLNASGYETHQIGTRIECYELPEPLVVGEACSGFRLLISLLTFTAFFVYMVQAPGWKKAVLVAAALPLSLFINSLRITMIGYAGLWTGSADAMHEFHDWSGYLGLVICFVILFGVARLIKANEFVVSFPSESSSSPAAVAASSKRSYGSSWQGFAAIVVLGLLVVAQLGIKPLDSSAMGTWNRSDMPRAFGAWVSSDIKVEKNVSDLLWTADLFQRVYMDSDTGRSVMLWGEAARDTTSFHDPHSCLPGGGTPITQDRVVTIKLSRPRPLTIKATLLEASGENGASYVIHWYMIGDHSYPSTPAIRRQVRQDQVGAFFQQLTHPFGGRAAKEEQYYWYRFSTDDLTGDNKSDVAALKRFIAEYFAHSKNLGQLEERRGT